jgi:hypothetical protein
MVEPVPERLPEYRRCGWSGSAPELHPLETRIAPFRKAFRASSYRCRIDQGIFNETTDFKRILRIVDTVSTTSFFVRSGSTFFLILDHYRHRVCKPLFHPPHLPCPERASRIGSSITSTQNPGTKRLQINTLHRVVILPYGLLKSSREVDALAFNLSTPADQSCWKENEICLTLCPPTTPCPSLL